MGLVPYMLSVTNGSRVKVGSTDTDGDATPQPSMIRYNFTTKKFQGYTEDKGDGTPGWVDL